MSPSMLRHGAAALTISALGLGVAATVSLTGPEQNTAQPVAVQATAQPTLQTAKLKSQADQRAEKLAKASAVYATASRTKTVKERDKALAVAAAASRKQAERLAARRDQGVSAKFKPGPTKPGRTKPASRPVKSDGKNCLPITSGYRIAARFGQVGNWSRYHTGIDLSAGIGTPIHAPAAGVVTLAGRGRASGWAGNYVAIRYPDGTSTLMAHMSTVSVKVGQAVSACQVVGAVGMTGRTFGPHLHFEAYPVGVTPGDLYSAVNPVGWLTARGLRP